MAGESVKLVEFAATVAWAPLTLSVTTRPVPVSGPEMVPPTLKVLTAQVTTTLVTGPEPTVPVAPLVTEQLSVGLAGWPVTETW
jgi:hypothetical protein